jgi:hypothetical protein
MKKLTASAHITTSVGFPPKSGTWDFLQEAHQETTKALAEAKIAGMPVASTYPYILYGCEYSDDGVNYVVTAGAMYYNGEVFLVDAVGSTALPGGSDLVICKIVTTTVTAATADPVTFTDGSTPSVHTVRKIVIGTGTGATTGYISDLEDVETAPNQGTEVGSYVTSDVFRMNKNYVGDFNWGLGTEISFDFTNPAVGSKIVLSGAISATATFDLVLASNEFAIVYDSNAGTMAQYNNTSAQIIPGTVGSGYAIVEIEYVGVRSSNHYINVKVYYP